MQSHNKDAQIRMRRGSDERKETGQSTIRMVTIVSWGESCQVFLKYQIIIQLSMSSERDVVLMQIRSDKTD